MKESNIIIINHFTVIGRYIVPEGHAGHLTKRLEARPVPFKSAKKWSSFKQIKFKANQKRSTGNFVK